MSVTRRVAPGDASLPEVEREAETLSASTTKGMSKGIALSDLPDDAAEMLSVLDTDGDGVISQREIAQLKRQDATTLHSRIPSLRSRLQAIWELVVSGKWLMAHTRYNDFPDPADDDVSTFGQSMNNVGLLAALLFTVIADMLFNYVDPTSPLSVLVSLVILTTMLLYFTSCTWSVFNLLCITQVDGKLEGRALLVRMGWRCAMPAHPQPAPITPVPHSAQRRRTTHWAPYCECPTTNPLTNTHGSPLQAEAYSRGPTLLHVALQVCCNVRFKSSQVLTCKQ